MGGQSVSRLTQWLAIVAIALDRKLGDFISLFFKHFLDDYVLSIAALEQWGKAGVGIQALCNEPNAQGSTDTANLNANLPGYLP